MRVLRVFHGGGVEGYQRRDEEIAKLGCSVTLIVPKVFRELPSATHASERNDLIEVVPVGLYGFRRNPFYFYNPFRIAIVARRSRPVIVDIHEEPYSLAAASVLLGLLLSGKRDATRKIFRSSQNVFKVYPPPFRWIQAWMMASAASAYVPSEEARRVLEQKGFTKQISVIGNGVEIPDRIERRPSWDDVLQIAYVGRLIERKGVSDLLEAISKMDRRVELVVVGDGPDRDLLENLALEGSRPGLKVHFVGNVDHSAVGQFLAASHVVCVPSRKLDGWEEQFSRALAEGMAHGCVPVVSDSGALGEVSGGLTRPFSAGDPEGLREVLNSLRGSDFGRLSELARERAIERYSWGTGSRAIVALYQAQEG